MQTYSPKDFKHLLGLTGLSDVLLTNHFTLYEGYVTNTNKLIELLGSKEIGTPEYSELQRRFGWEWNGMRMHELYFGNMTKESSPLKDGMLKEKIEKTYNSFENWEKNFLGLGAMRGIGWVVLAHDTEKDELMNVWVNEHDLGHLVGTTPILVMDVFEHAYMLDYGIKKAGYLETFSRSINWTAAEERLSKK
ncbi:MAG: superoxide dismutase [Candidatus Moranbacteria bacterium RIFCSPLOWO2_02_FULL_48_19]|nr:MAG: superoxide dismutase [Candidatus Moranbacteria bacterium RIFCSPLOWO2_02_FULL_48_19]OGI30794.1 MAG: superoxide dismutase [Candidatus Moranbacteria bacterium RIFCSPLOWO2_12_FULL_48_12]